MDAGRELRVPCVRVCRAWAYRVLDVHRRVLDVHRARDGLQAAHRREQDVRLELVVHRCARDVHHHATDARHHAHRPRRVRRGLRRHHATNASPDPSPLVSASLGHDRTTSAAQCNREFISAWQFFQMAQRELFEEEWRRSVQQRATHSFRTSDDVDQSALVQRLEHTTDGNTANFLDFGAPDGLAIRNDRECLE